MPNRPLLLLIALLAVVPTALAAESASERLLTRSIAHHDPDGVWGTRPVRLVFEESRPDGSVRMTRVLIDLPRERFEWSSQRGDDLLEGTLSRDGCSVALNGSAQISEVDRAAHRLDCDRVELYRNYYTYLWGLPMKLRDPGTILDPDVRDDEFRGRPVQRLLVTYEPDVGGDTWYFYFDPASAALVGYRFYHDEEANDGEYIVLEGEIESAGLRLPKSRTWFTHQGDRLLGTDDLVELGVESPISAPLP